MRRGEYQFTSPEDYHYNCIAWAAGNNTKWQGPPGLRIHYWPPGVPPEYTLESRVGVYTIHGYMPCDTAELEPGYEKVAVYVDSLGIPSHAAKQTEAGAWMSKLGEYDDIEHDALEALEGKDPAYGRVARILKRPRKQPS